MEDTCVKRVLSELKPFGLGENKAPLESESRISAPSPLLAIKRGFNRVKLPEGQEGQRKATRLGKMCTFLCALQLNGQLNDKHRLACSGPIF